MKKDLLKKVTVIGLALALALGMTACGESGNTEAGQQDSAAMTQELALEKALSEAGLSEDQVVNIESEMDDGNFDISFIDKATGDEYDFEFSPEGEVIGKSVEQGIADVSGGTSGEFNQEAAIAAALKEAKVEKSEVTGIEAEAEDGRYDVEFIKTSNGAEYSFEFDGNGKLLEKSVDYNRMPEAGEAKLSKDDAVTAAADFLKIDRAKVAAGYVGQDSDDGEVIFEISFSTDNWNYEVELSGVSGKVLEWSKERF